MWLKALSKIVADELLFLSFLFLIFFRENKTWHFMWIVCLADNSHEMPSFIFSEIFFFKNEMSSLIFSDTYKNQVFAAGEISDIYRYLKYLMIIPTYTYIHSCCWRPSWNWRITVSHECTCSLIRASVVSYLHGRHWHMLIFLLLFKKKNNNKIKNLHLHLPIIMIWIFFKSIILVQLALM